MHGGADLGLLSVGSRAKPTPVVVHLEVYYTITEAPYADVAEREHRPCGLCVVIRKAGHAKPGRGRGAERMRGEVTG